MAFTVEDGTGLPDANAYITLEYFEEYHLDRGNSHATYTDDQVRSAIIRATDYIDRRYRAAFVGLRQLNTQLLEWPRVSAFYRDGRWASGVPIEVRMATAEYALRGLAETLAPDPEYSDSNALVTGKLEQAGPVKEETQYGGDGAVISFRKYPLADSLLKELVTKGTELLRV